MKVPTDATPAIQQAFREVHAAIDKLGAGKLNTDMNGKRHINAGDAVQPADYVTLRQLQTVIAQIVTPTTAPPKQPPATPPSDGPLIPGPGAPGGGGSGPTPPHQQPPPHAQPPNAAPGGGTFSSTDMLNLSTVTILSSPADIATWPQAATLTAFTFDTGGVEVHFTKEQGATRWPDVIPPGFTGPIQYTLWLFLNIGGQWYGAGLIQFWYGLDRNGGPPSQMAFNWTGGNKSLWSPLGANQPAVGASVGFMLSAGNARDETDVSSVKERTQTVLIPMPSDAGTSYTT